MKCAKDESVKIFLAPDYRVLCKNARNAFRSIFRVFAFGKFSTTRYLIITLCRLAKMRNDGSEMSGEICRRRTSF